MNVLGIDIGYSNLKLAYGQQGTEPKVMLRPAGAAPADRMGEKIGGDSEEDFLRVLVNEGETVTAGQTVAVLESMKMEFPAAAPAAGTVRAVKCKPGSVAHAGQWLAVIETAP